MWTEVPLKQDGRWPKGVRVPIIISVHHQSEEAAVVFGDGQVDPFDVADVDQRREAIATHAQEDAAAPGIAARGVGAQAADRAAAAEMIEVEPEPRGHAVVVDRHLRLDHR